jgi:hypothetical protein
MNNGKYKHKILLSMIVKFREKIQPNATMYQNFIIPYLYKAQHVSGDTTPSSGA